LINEAFAGNDVQTAMLSVAAAVLDAAPKSNGSRSGEKRMFLIVDRFMIALIFQTSRSWRVASVADFPINAVQAMGPRSLAYLAWQHSPHRQKHLRT
jgi:hypothetical protein